MMCLGCPVRNECKEERKRTSSRYGIWAGERFNDQEEK